MDLHETFVVPSFRRNWISISSLDKYGLTCSFGNGKFGLFHEVGSGFSNLYSIDTVASYNETLQTNTRGAQQENSPMRIRLHCGTRD